ncbi:MAG: rod shape-determining protein MreC [Atopobiaceae bacterium]
MTVLLVVLSLVMFTVSSHESGSGVFTSMRYGFQTITTPLRMVGAGISAPFVGLGNVYRNLTADEATLTDLEQQNRELQAKNVELEESSQTAQRLQQLLNLQDTYNLQSVAANVIGGSTDSWTRTITLDKGTSGGVDVGMPVFDAYGAVGQVIQVASDSCTVRLLSDENSSVSAMIQSTRAQGMVEGSADGTLHLNLIRTDQEVNVGDVVVTSGLGGVFPKGLPMGKVTSVNKTPGALYYDIVVEPYSTADSYEEVWVVTSLTSDQQASADDIAEADAQQSSGETSTSSDSSSTDGPGSSDSSSSQGSGSSSSTSSSTNSGSSTPTGGSSSASGSDNSSSTSAAG